MLFTREMMHLTAVVLNRHSEACTRALLDLGILDMVRISDLPGGQDSRISPLEMTSSLSRLHEAKGRLENLIKGTEKTSWQPPDISLENLEELNIDDAEKEMDSLAARGQEMREQQRLHQQEILRLEEMARQVALFGNTAAGIQNPSSSSFLNIKTGTVPSDRSTELASAISRIPSVLLPLGQRGEEKAFLLICLKKDEHSMQRILEEKGWKNRELSAGDEQISLKDNAIEELHAKIDALKKKQSTLESEYKSTMHAKYQWMKETWQKLMARELYFRIQKDFSHTDRTVIFSGWVPARQKKRIEDTIRSAVESDCFIYWQAARSIHTETRGKVQPPVELSNPAALKPFEMLVKNYAVPEYGAIDPTPFVAVAYLSMFGLMFGDAGHGLVLVLLGFLARRFVPVYKEGMRNLALLVQYCGIAAVVTGILFGSYFGLPLFPALWFNYHSLVAGHSGGNPLFTSIYDILLVTIWFGIAVIGTGLVLNWINLFGKRNWHKLVFDKGGILGGWMYAFGVYSAFYFASNDYRVLPATSVLVAGFAVPALLLLLKEPLHPVFSHRDHGKPHGKQFSIMDMIMEWIVELLEIFSGYLANTLSFMRVAGLGIAHVSLMIAFTQIAENVAGSIMSPGGFAIYLIGNIMVIALEGLSAGIQSLRLNYYEFFSRYFTGSGKAYMPLSLKSR